MILLKLIIKQRKSLIPFYCLTLFFIFFATRGCATSQDLQCDPHKDDEQQLRDRLTRHLKISAGLQSRGTNDFAGFSIIKSRNY